MLLPPDEKALPGFNVLPIARIEIDPNLIVSQKAVHAVKPSNAIRVKDETDPMCAALMTSAEVKIVVRRRTALGLNQKKEKGASVLNIADWTKVVP